MADRFALDYPLMHWLLTEARRIAEPKAFLAALAEQLLAHGIEVSRLTTGVPILHPQVHSYSARWDLGQGVSERFFRLTAETLPTLANSPVKTVYSGGGSVRCDPTAPPREGEFGILADLRNEGDDRLRRAEHSLLGRNREAPDRRNPPQGRLFRRGDGAARGHDAGRRGQSRGAGAALHRAHPARHLCRPPGRRPRAGRRDQARHGRDDPRGHLAVRPARLHQPFRETAARRADRAPQRIFRPHVRRARCRRRRSAEIRRRCVAFAGIFPILEQDDPASVCARALAAAADAQASLAIFNAGRIGPATPGSTTASRCTSATSCTAISAARTGSTSRSSARPSTWLPASRGCAAISAARSCSPPASSRPPEPRAEPLGSFSLKGLAEPQQVYAPAVGAA